MDITELRNRQADFEGNRQSFKKEADQLEELRSEFVTKFPIETLQGLPLEKYVVGEVDKDGESFCYQLETKLLRLGNIKGATAFKFGVYYGKTKTDTEKKYRFQSRFGETLEDAYRNVRQDIVDLINAGESNDTEQIRENPLSPMFKGKILATYFPNKYLSIFAKEHIDYFIDKLGIAITTLHLDEVQKRKALVDFKNEDTVMRAWSIYEFSRFLYSQFGRPTDAEHVHEELREYILPPFVSVKAEFVDLSLEALAQTSVQTHGHDKAYKPDYEENARRNMALGKRGEDVVFEMEKVYLKSIGREDLADQIKHHSLRDDSYGYDIQSYDEKGEEKYIEVKATRSDAEQFSFSITGRELEVAREMREKYSIYIVFKASTSAPKIFRMGNPFVTGEDYVRLTPSNYRVLINPQRAE